MARSRDSIAFVGGRRQTLCEVALVAALLIAVALSNAFSEVTDYQRLGDALPLWQALTWEFSSVALTGALIPAVVWFTRRMPLVNGRWYRAAPVHLLASVPFSLAHVAGMVALRKLVYAAVGSAYHFGPALSGWVYEYRKDFVTYWTIVGIATAFGAWRYWRSAHAAVLAPRRDGESVPVGAVAGLNRLVVQRLNREYILDAGAIVRLEANGNYVTVYANAMRYQVRGSLAGVTARLDARRFVRIHRCQAVNLDHVREIQPWGHGDYRVVLDDGVVVNLSRRYRAGFDRAIDPEVACGRAAHT